MITKEYLQRMEKSLLLAKSRNTKFCSIGVSDMLEILQMLHAVEPANEAELDTTPASTCPECFALQIVTHKKNCSHYEPPVS